MAASVGIYAMTFSFLMLLDALLGLSIQRANSLVPFRLYTDFQSEPPKAVREAMREELESIMSPIGWPIEWSPMPRTTYAEMSVTLAIARFRGMCDVADLAPGSNPRTVLGSTNVTNGRILPFADVDCDAIVSFLGSVLTCVSVEKRRIIFGRAVARVLAHELYHILAMEEGHTASGLGAAAFCAQDLVARQFLFGRKEVQKLRISLVPVLRSSGRVPGVGKDKGASLFITSGCTGCHGPRGEGTRWGPALRMDSVTHYPEELAWRQVNVFAEMHKRGKNLKIQWPRLKAAEVELLSAYLRRLRPQDR